MVALVNPKGNRVRPGERCPGGLPRAGHEGQAGGRGVPRRGFVCACVRDRGACGVQGGVAKGWGPAHGAHHAGVDVSLSMDAVLEVKRALRNSKRGLLLKEGFLHDRAPRVEASDAT